MLPLTFADPSDYDKVAPTDRLAIRGLKTFAPGKPLTLEGTRADGTNYTLTVNHTFNDNQARPAAGPLPARRCSRD